MVKKLLFMLASFIFLTVSAQNQYIEKYDIGHDFSSINSTYYFWQKVKNKDRSYQIFQRAEKRGTKTYLEARNILLNAMNGAYEELKNLNSMLSYKEVCDSLYEVLRIRDISPNIEIKVVDNYDLNAYMTPNGFMVINSGLIKELTFPQVVAVCCHELTHYMLEHCLVEKYMAVRKQKQNNVWAGVLGGLAMAGTAASNLYAASNGVMINSNTQTSQYTMIAILSDEAAQTGAYNYRFRYSREQEMQADIIGFRYLEYLGYSGDEYKSMLKTIGTSEDAHYSKKSKHPKVAYRIKTIEKLEKKNEKEAHKLEKNKEKEALKLEKKKKKEAMKLEKKQNGNHKLKS